jgi:hypothetical protein
LPRKVWSCSYIEPKLIYLRSCSRIFTSKSFIICRKFVPFFKYGFLRTWVRIFRLSSSPNCAASKRSFSTARLSAVFHALSCIMISVSSSFTISLAGSDMQCRLLIAIFYRDVGGLLKHASSASPLPLKTARCCRLKNPVTLRPFKYKRKGLRRMRQERIRGRSRKSTVP